MKKLSKIFLAVSLVSVFGCGMVAAQDSGMFLRHLADPDTVYHARVRVTEHGTAESMMRDYNSRRTPKRSIPGYRVRIFFANNQTARQDALDTQARFRSQYPDIPTYIVYETPSWMVTVGNCMNIDEALILLGRVNPRYRTAFIWRGDIPVDEFLKSGDVTEEEVAEEPEPLLLQDI